MEVVTFLLAVWGAILSTILGIREIIREKRSLLVILERIHFVERSQLIVSNIGYRPVTIVNIVVYDRISSKGLKRLFKQENKAGFVIRTSILDHINCDNGIRFPITLEDSRSVTIQLDEYIANELLDNNREPTKDIVVWDSEGKEYKISKRRSFNPKYQSYDI